MAYDGNLTLGCFGWRNLMCWKAWDFCQWHYKNGTKTLVKARETNGEQDLSIQTTFLQRKFWRIYPMHMAAWLGGCVESMWSKEEVLPGVPNQMGILKHQCCCSSSPVEIVCVLCCYLKVWFPWSACLQSNKKRHNIISRWVKTPNCASCNAVQNSDPTGKSRG